MILSSSWCGGSRIVRRGSGSSASTSTSTSKGAVSEGAVLLVLILTINSLEVVYGLGVEVGELLEGSSLNILRNS